MNRVRFMLLCGGCGEVRREERGVFMCSCDEQSWLKARHEKGTESEEDYFAKHGFHFVEDVLGDRYYLGPYEHIVHLLENNQWASNKAPGDCYYLHQYIAWIDSKQHVN